ncbi:MAG TPA: single-stranded DNA-binding protein [Caldisericia bacterium]|nr:single-stranded DNA-binding protein [Caldisericia bacterium]HPF48985.1 single-stranded DNA-binding protein [Caldisericia bacterium]HPI83151.1 single-stranded DNA-binding protein [Caldisericia bacterium]HPQ92378.1 single-stranded DNA-binding protein [Caldisericia bacterium]HRV74524.1 single-stranded DNA-binding protein [Caldisericia bacterium]
MLNRVFLIGNLVADPEIRYTPSGSPVGSFRLACTEKFKSRDGGEMKEQTLFINCSVWGNQATVVQQYLKKGSRLFVEGRLQIRDYEQDGIRKWFTSVNVRSFKFLDKRSDENKSSQGDYDSKEDFSPPEFSDDDIPFS